MRIIAGSARRRELKVATGSATRPFLEMARGALFNSLGAKVEGALVLDLYAGSGALGLEALSRGAASCVFVERDPGAAGALHDNIAACGMQDKARLLRQDVGRMLAADSGRYDLVFIDPPFPELAEWREDGRCGGIMQAIGRLLREDGLALFRLEEGKFSPPRWPGLTLLKDIRHGRSRVCRYGLDANREEGS